MSWLILIVIALALGATLSALSRRRLRAAPQRPGWTCPGCGRHWIDIPPDRSAPCPYCTAQQRARTMGFDE